MIDEEHERFMRLALEQAGLANGDVPVGAVVLRGTEILGLGRNQRELLQDPSAHAEIVAMREAAKAIGSWRLDGLTIVCTLEPCPMCAEAILQARIATLVYGARDFIYGATGSAFNLYSSHRTFPVPKVISGVLETECKRLLQDYFQAQRAKNR